MSSTLDAVILALETEFTLEIAFSPTIPTALTAPSVVVHPAADYIEPETLGGAGGLVRERWNILCVVNVSEAKPGLDLMRNLSLRVRKALLGTGAVWRGSSGPQRLASDNSNLVFSVNEIDFKYDPAQHLP